MPRLVATDVDGTLLDPTDQVSERTRAAVHRVVAAGVPFVLVTGRPPRWIPPIVEQLGRAGLTARDVDEDLGTVRDTAAWLGKQGSDSVSRLVESARRLVGL